MPDSPGSPPSPPLAGDDERDPGAPAPGTSGRRLPSGRHGLPRAFVVGDQRERLLDGAGQAFAAAGFARTRVADITALAGVSRTTFYELFSDKETCFLATYDTVSAILFARVQEAIVASLGLPWEDRMRIGIRSFLETLQAEPAFTRMCIVEVVAAGPQALARRDQVMRGFAHVITDGLAEAPHRRENVPALAPELFVGGMYEAVYARILRGEGDRLVELEDDLVATALTLFLDR